MFVKAKSRNPVFEKSQSLEFNVWKKPKFKNFNVCKSQRLDFQCLEKGKI